MQMGEQDYCYDGSRDAILVSPIINHKLTHNMLSKQSFNNSPHPRVQKPLSYSSFFTLCANPEIPENLPTSPKLKSKLPGKISIKQTKVSALKLGSCRSLTSLPSQETVRYLPTPIFQHNMSFFTKNKQISVKHLSSQVKDKPPTARFSYNIRSQEQQGQVKHFITQPYDYRFHKRLCQQYSASHKNNEYKLQNEQKHGRELLSTLANSKDGKVLQTFSSFAPPAIAQQRYISSFKKDPKLLQKSISLQNSIIFEPQPLNLSISNHYPEHPHRSESSIPSSSDPYSPTFSKPVLGRLSVRNVHSIHGQESSGSAHQSIIIQDFDSLMRKVRLNRLESWDVEEQFIEI